MCLFRDFERLILMSLHEEFKSYIFKFSRYHYYLELKIEDCVLEKWIKKKRQHDIKEIIFIPIEYSLKDTSILQWSTRDTTLQINTRSCLCPKATKGMRAVCIKLPWVTNSQRQSSGVTNRPTASSSLASQASTRARWTFGPLRKQTEGSTSWIPFERTHMSLPKSRTKLTVIATYGRAFAATTHEGRHGR